MSGKDNMLAELRILLVEDQIDVRTILHSMLDELGVTHIFSAHNGEEAFDFMETGSNRIDMVICDWNMPHMNGVELLRRLRDAHHNMPFLMITGRSDLESVVQAKSCGVTGYIRKPFSAAQLEAKMRIILQRMAA